MPMHNDLLGRRVGERLRVARLNNNLSQKELGELIGTSKQQIFKYENAIDIPSLSRLVQLSEALNVSPFFFLEGHVNPRGIPKNIVVENILFQAYAVLNQQNRILLLAIAEALVECSSTYRTHRPQKTTRSLGALAGEFRGPTINP
jgi:transcriptional regulator with XRE-family HTH domain